jgi:hypothetical protein
MPFGIDYLDATILICTATASVMYITRTTLINPRHWNAVTWVAMVFWILWALDRNLPYEAGPQVLVEINARRDEYGLARRDWMSARMGFPHTYASVHFNTTQVTATSFSQLALFSNIVTTLLSLCGLIIIFQTRKIFSVRSMFILCTAVALPIALYAAVKPGYPVNQWCKEAVFLSPQLAAPFLLIRRLCMTKCSTKAAEPSELTIAK